MHDHAVRRYQRDIIESGGFSIVSPVDGDVVSPSVCHVVNNGDDAFGNIGIAYRLPGEKGVWLLADSVKDGFPITELFWTGQDAYCREHLPWKARLRAMEQEVHWSNFPRIDRSRPVLLLGHPNFAHHLWNELSGLYHYSGWHGPAPAALRIDCTYQPLAPLEDFLPGFSAHWHSVQRLEDLQGFRDGMVTRLGSTRIPAGLREKVISWVGAHHNRAVTDAVAAALQGGSPVIWLSLRLDARTADNQQEFIDRLAQVIAERYPAAAFILDGFSYPADFGSAVYAQPRNTGSGSLFAHLRSRGDGHLAGRMKAREREISAYVSRFKRKLGRCVANPIVSISGMGLLDSLYLAHFADYYVCHAGTLQHKVAWIYNIPGTVHSNTAGVGPGSGRWLARQLEDGVQPAMVSVEHIDDLDTIRTANQVARNRDYHIRDIDTVVAGIIADMEARIHPAANGFAP